MADIKGFLEDLLGVPLVEQGNPNVSVHCICGQHNGPNGEDAEKSMSLEVHKGLWTCHASGSGGNLVKLIQLAKHVERDEAFRIAKTAGITQDDIYNGSTVKRDEEARDATRPLVPQPVADAYEKNLINNPGRRKYLLDSIGWNAATLDAFHIGWNNDTKRYTFPVVDKKNDLVNIRMYDPDNVNGAQKLTSWTKGHGIVNLWPEECPQAPIVILCEGEKDCITMSQMIRENAIINTTAISATGGCGTWKPHWNKRFAGKEVWIVYDMDTPGENASQKIASAIQGDALKIKIIVLESDRTDGYDVTDFFLKDNKSWVDFKAIVDATEYWTTSTIRVRTKPPKDETLYKPHLSEASDEKYLFKDQELQILVAGKTNWPYAIPAEMTYACGVDYAKAACDKCSLSSTNGVKEIKFSDEDPTIIRLVNITDAQQQQMIRVENGINTRCPKVDVDIEKFHNIEELTIVPEIDFAEEDRPYETRTMYTTTHGIQANRTYLIRGTTLPHPRTQHVVHFATEIEPAQDNIDDFVITDDLREAFKVFQVHPGMTVADKFEEIANDHATNVTHIYGRNDIIKAVSLCYHTVIAFNFDSKPVAKAWGDILILGDTREGKSESVQELIKHYRLGEIAVSENMTRAGLLGGLKSEAGGRWNVMWGKIPLNNRRLLVIDEASGLDPDTIGQLSGIRSNGLAELVQIETQKTMARTRLIWMSNPRSNKMMGEYAYGVEAVKELMVQPEDVARFDLVVTAAANEVSSEIINMPESERTPVKHIFTSQLSHDLALWAWSRKSNQIYFHEDAVKAIYKGAIEQSKRYSSRGGIALIQAANHRLKLAKLAVSAACQTFATIDGNNVIVQESHVKFIIDFLDEIYDKPSLDYSGWSEAVLSRQNISQEKIEEVRNWIRSHGDWAETWLFDKQLRLDDFRTQFDLSADDAKRLIFKPLAVLNMISRNTNGSYEKTQPFIDQIKYIKNTEGLTPTVMGPSSGGGGSTSGTSSPGSAGYTNNSGFGELPADDDIPF